MNRQVGIASLVLALALGITIAAEIVLPAGEAPEDATGVKVAPRPLRVHAPKPAAPQDDQTDTWMATVLARPLFTRDRRPTNAPASAASSSVSDTLPRLTGIAVSPYGRSAIFAGSEGGKPLVLTEGASVGLYTVEAIGPRAVKLTGPGGEKTVSPVFDPTPKRTEVEIPNQQPGANGQQPPPELGPPPGVPGQPPLQPPFQPFRPPGLPGFRPRIGDGA